MKVNRKKKVSVKDIVGVNFQSMIRFEASKRPSSKVYAEELGISQQHLSDLKYGRRRPSDEILAKFGLQWNITKIREQVDE